MQFQRFFLAGAALVLPIWLAAQKSEPFVNYTETISHTRVQFEMIPIPGGTFVMGSPESEPGRKAEEGPQHTVSSTFFPGSGVISCLTGRAPSESIKGLF